MLECFKYGSQFITERKLNNINNIFWEDILITFKTFIDLVKPSNFKELMNITLWGNKNLKVGGTSVFYKTWIDNGIMFIRDLIGANGQRKTFQSHLTRRIAMINICNSFRNLSHLLMTFAQSKKQT